MKSLSLETTTGNISHITSYSFSIYKQIKKRKREREGKRQGNKEGRKERSEGGRNERRRGKRERKGKER